MCVTSPVAGDFPERWPSLQKVQKERPETLRKFFVQPAGGYMVEVKQVVVSALELGSLHSLVASADTLQVGKSLLILWIQSEGRLIVSGGSNEIPFAFKNSCPHHVCGF